MFERKTGIENKWEIEYPNFARNGKKFIKHMKMSFLVQNIQNKCYNKFTQFFCKDVNGRAVLKGYCEVWVHKV